MVDGPTIVGEASTTVQATPAEVFAFVLDLHRYREADHKIGRIGAVHREGSTGTATFSGRIRGLPAPSGTFPFTLGEDLLEFRTPTAGPARWFVETFQATVHCEVTDAGTRVTHREVFGFRRPWRWIAHPALRSWLAADTAVEMSRVKQILDGSAATGEDPADGRVDAARSSR